MVAGSRFEGADVTEREGMVLGSRFEGAVRHGCGPSLREKARWQEQAICSQEAETNAAVTFLLFSLGPQPVECGLPT